MPSSSRGEITNVGIDAQIAVLEPVFGVCQEEVRNEMYIWAGAYTKRRRLLEKVGTLAHFEQALANESRSAIPEYAGRGAGSPRRHCWSGGSVEAPWGSFGVGEGGPAGSQKIWGCRHVWCPKHGPNQFHHSPGRMSKKASVSKSLSAGLSSGQEIEVKAQIL